MFEWLTDWYSSLSGFLQAKVWWVALVCGLAFLAGLLGFLDGQKAPSEHRELE